MRISNAQDLGSYIRDGYTRIEAKKLVMQWEVYEHTVREGLSRSDALILIQKMSDSEIRKKYFKIVRGEGGRFQY